MSDQPIRTPVFKKPVRTPVFRTNETAPKSAVLERIGTLPDLQEINAKVKESGMTDGGLGRILQTSGRGVTDAAVYAAARESVLEAGSDAIWDGALGQMLMASTAFFAQEILTGAPEPPYNGRFLIGDHHIRWDHILATNKRNCLLAARDHGKSFFVDFAYPIQQLIKWPGESGFIWSATREQAIRIMDDIRTEIETNPRLQWLMPDRKKDRLFKWGSTHIRCSNGSRLYARGYGTRVRGGHPRYGIVDDGLGDETIYSELVRLKQIDYFLTAITNMIIPGGQINVIGTPFHNEDLYAQLRDNPKYYFEVFPAETNPGFPDNRPLWGDRYSLPMLQDKKDEIGTMRYTREFLCEPISDDMSIFPHGLFRGDPTEQFSVTLGMPGAFWEKAGVQTFIGVDFAISTTAQADYTVIWTMGRDNMGNRWIIDIKRAKGLPYREQLSLINATAREYDPALIFLEDNQMQAIFGQELIRQTDLPIKPFTTGRQKHSLEFGVPALRVLLENQKFRIPRGDQRSVELTDTWINEMRAFTWNRGKLESVAGHDDMVMACWICNSAVEAGGFQFSFGDDEAGEVTQETMDQLYAELTGEAEVVERTLEDGLSATDDYVANLVGDEYPMV